MFVLTAKHGQSPADYAKLKKIGDTVSGTLGALVGGGSDAITGNNLGNGQATTDDVAFVWLNDQTSRTAAVTALQNNASCPTVDSSSKVILGNSVSQGICTDNGGRVTDLSVNQIFGDPANGRTPDIMVQPNSGVIYSTSGKKDMEHGGFAPDDGHVALVVSYSGLRGETVHERVQTTQVAPTIIKALGLDPALLQSVQVEGTKVLPELFEHR